EVDFCRHRLGELRAAFERPAPEPAVGAEEQLLPPGCESLEQAAERVLAQITPEDVRALDRRLQGMVERQFVALVHVCLTSSGLMGNLEALMLQQARDFLAHRLGPMN